MTSGSTITTGIIHSSGPLIKTALMASLIEPFGVRDAPAASATAFSYSSTVLVCDLVDQLRESAATLGIDHVFLGEDESDENVTISTVIDALAQSVDTEPSKLHELRTFTSELREFDPVTMHSVLRILRGLNQESNLLGYETMSAYSSIRSAHGDIGGLTEVGGAGFAAGLDTETMKTHLLCIAAAVQDEQLDAAAGGLIELMKQASDGIEDRHVRADILGRAVIRLQQLATESRLSAENATVEEDDQSFGPSMG